MLAFNEVKEVFMFDVMQGKPIEEAIFSAIQSWLPPDLWQEPRQVQLAVDTLCFLAGSIHVCSPELADQILLKLCPVEESENLIFQQKVDAAEFAEAGGNFRVLSDAKHLLQDEWG